MIAPTLLLSIGVALAAFGLGSIPFGLLFVRLSTGRDVREVGSGNIGATNALRAGGKLVGIATLLADAGKGALAVGLPALLPPGLLPADAPFVAAVAVVLGHCYPPWLRFQGGKGVATALGVLLVLAPAIAGLSVLAFLGSFAATRRSSVGSLAAVLVAAGASPWLTSTGDERWAVLSIVLVVIVRHAENLKRLFAGREPKL